MQVEENNLSLSARSFPNESSHQHSQFIPGSWFDDQNVDIYPGNPEPDAYMPFVYNGYSDSQVDHAPGTLNEPPADTGVYNAQCSEPAQQFRGILPVQTANDMDPMAHSFSNIGETNYASTNDSRSSPTFSYEHRCSGHLNSGFLSRSHENTRRSFSQPHDSIQPNSFGSSDMARLMVPDNRKLAPPDTPLHTRITHFTPPRQTSNGKGENPNPKVAHCRPQGKPSETDQARKRKARKGQGPACKEKDNVEQRSFRIAKRRPSKKPALGSKRYPHSRTIAACSLWLSQNPGKMPTEHGMSCLSENFGSCIETIRNWFIQNVTDSIEDEDTGYQTMKDLDTDITSLYQGNRGCKRKATSIGVRALTSIQIPRNEARPYACTSRCSKSFKDKAAWERHEEKNRVQRLWVCSFEGCRNKEQRKRVWLNRKEHYINHVSTHHPGLGPTPQNMEDCYVEMRLNFDRRCIFKLCDKIFHSWKERINHIGAHLRGPWHMSDWRDMDEEEKDMDATDASEDEIDDSDSDDPGAESDSDDTEDDIPGLGPSGSSYDQGADRLGGHPGSSAQRPGSNSHHRRHRGDDYTRPSKHGCMTYGSQADSAVSDISLAEPFPRSEDHFSVSSQAKPRLNTRDYPVPCLDLASQPIHQSMRIYPLRLLGRGSSAIVEEVKMKGYEVTFARKRISNCTQAQQRSLHREVIVMARLKHPHVIRFIASYQQMNSINYLLRPVADCNLLQYMTAQPTGSGYRSKMQGWFRCLASGLQYLHSSGVRHRDIKPSNVLVRDDRILYTDFGSSNIIPDDDSSESDSADFTERYAAPEVFRGRRGRAADVWALGCVYFEMAAFLLKDPLWDGRERPYESNIFFPDAGDQHMESRWGTNTGMEASMSPSEFDISTMQTYCKAMMDPRPEQRPTAAEITGQIPARVCCEEQVEIIPQPQAAGGCSSSTGSDRTLSSYSCGEEVMSLDPVLSSTSYTPWRGSRTILKGIPEELLPTEIADPAFKATRQHGIRKRRGEKEELKEAVISERTKRSESAPCDETADFPRAVPSLVNKSDDVTLSDNSCITVPSRSRGANSYRLPFAMKRFLEEKDSWQEFSVSGKVRTQDERRSCVTGLLEDVPVTTWYVIETRDNQSSWAAFSDFVLAIYPVLLLRNVKISTRAKIGLSLLMAGGVLNTTYALSYLVIWAWTEEWLVLILGSLPPLRPLFLLIFNASPATNGAVGYR
ncbi:hypothetical protein JMJ35_003704 [Cladonia borealis]|uniref:non-specific serine/threonine protein kinase n=1 Tax=Cladonia borealis TaxID=184061 RepID=A0AA39R301_9LECA|nr:hypothetical protein JMJ35_003704 [Cladonia borealis]